MKASHGSGDVVVVSATAGPEVQLPRPPAGWPQVMLRPEQLDWELLRGLAAEWLELRHSAAEWAYRHVPPRLVVEELLLAPRHSTRREIVPLAKQTALEP